MKSLPTVFLALVVLTTQPILGAPPPFLKTRAELDAHPFFAQHFLHRDVGSSAHDAPQCALLGATYASTRAALAAVENLKYIAQEECRVPPRECKMISCTKKAEGSAAVWLCNDQQHEYTHIKCANLAPAVRNIMDHCLDGGQMVATMDGWRVKLQGC